MKDAADNPAANWLTAPLFPCIDFQTARLSEAANGDVVCLAASEIMQCRTEARGLYHPHIHLQAGTKYDRGKGRSVGQDLGHLVIGCKACHDGTASVGGHQDIQLLVERLDPLGAEARYGE